MKQLDLSWNKIDDDGAAMFLRCLSNVKRLELHHCNISFAMQTELYERGKEEGCEVNYGCVLTYCNSKVANKMNFNDTHNFNDKQDKGVEIYFLAELITYYSVVEQWFHYQCIAIQS